LNYVPAGVRVFDLQTRFECIVSNIQNRTARWSVLRLGSVALAMGGGLLWQGAALAQAPEAAPIAPPVSTAVASRRDVPILLKNIGTVQAFQSVLIRARVDGTLEKVFFKEGQDVKTGDKLAEIDPRPYAAALAAAQAKQASDTALLANARRDLARYASLARNDYASRQQLDTQTALVAEDQAGLQGDAAAIATAQLNLDFCTIKSPIDGRAGLRLVDAGNLVHATDATGLVTIDQIHPISVIFTLPQGNLPDIREAMSKQKLPVMAYAQNGTTLLDKGELATTDNTIDQATGTIKLKAAFPNPDDKLWPGQFVNVALQIGVRNNVVTVPSEAVNHGPAGLFVFIVKPDSTVAVQPIEVVADDGQVAVIGKGLDAGAQVVTNGQSRLQNGIKVTVIAAKANS
jgi:multidrug efflux system membrane fusion protein